MEDDDEAKQEAIRTKLKLQSSTVEVSIAVWWHSISWLASVRLLTPALFLTVCRCQMISRLCGKQDDPTIAVETVLSTRGEQREQHVDSLYAQVEAHFEAGRQEAGKQLLHQMNREDAEWLLEKLPPESLFSLGVRHTQG